MNFKVEFIENAQILDVFFGEIQKVGGIAEDVPLYDGAYDVTPAVDAQTLPTAQKFLTSNIDVAAIPYAEVSNNSGGKTVIIG